MDRRHAIYGFVVLCMLFAGAELMMVLGSSDFLMLMAWDISIYVDAVIAVWTVAAVTRLKGFSAYLSGSAVFSAARPGPAHPVAV